MKYLLGETTTAENAKVKAWLQADAGNQAYYDELKKIWDNSLQLAASSTVDENKAWQRFRQRISDNGTVTASPVRSIPARRSNGVRIAASIILVIGLGIMGYWLYNSNQPAQTMLAQTTSNVITDTLPDGSMVTLNKASSLSYPSEFEGKKRAVKLTGEAFFKVTPDKKKPFVISVNDVEVTVVGTSFNIRTVNGFTEVIVETGIVRVTRNGKTIELHPNEKLQTTKIDTLEKEIIKDKLYNYYNTKEFVCDDTPLWKLVEVLNEAYQSNIVIGRDELRNQRINITLKNESLDRILELISATLPVKITKTNEQVVIE